MKIISGYLKGRIIKGFNIEGTRPTMDRVKESLFAIIQEYLKDSIILDLFAGSGNLGIEAISNGAKFCYFNDVNKKCAKIIKDNLENFSIIDKSQLINKDWQDCLKYLAEKHIKTDIVFLDPPYQMDCLNEVIATMVKDDLLSQKGLIICEVSNDYIASFANLDKIKSKRYGNKMVIILKRNKNI